MQRSERHWGMICPGFYSIRPNAAILERVMPHQKLQEVEDVDAAFRQEATKRDAPPPLGLSRDDRQSDALHNKRAACAFCRVDEIVAKRPLADRNIRFRVVCARRKPHAVDCRRLDRERMAFEVEARVTWGQTPPSLSKILFIGPFLEVISPIIEMRFQCGKILSSAIGGDRPRLLGRKKRFEDLGMFTDPRSNGDSRSELWRRAEKRAVSAR